MADWYKKRMAQFPAVVMGIVNTTPDSFSDGGLFSDADAAIRHGIKLVEHGAEILDVGGESTRPNASPVSLDEELARVIPVIEGLCDATDKPISIDTTKPEVMRAAVEAGAKMVNDVNGLQADKALETLAELAVPACIMHRQGSAKTMQVKPSYDDVVETVITFFEERLAACVEAGIEQERICIDPGIGFGKTLKHNLLLLNAVDTFLDRVNCDVLIGVSRKSMLAKLLGREVDERLPASLGLAVQAVLNGAKIVRVHDVKETVDAVRAAEAVKSARQD